MKRGAELAWLSLALALVVPAFGGCGGGDSGPPLAWESAPRLITTPTEARVLVGRVTNHSSGQLALSAKGLKLLDAQGRRLPASTIFLASFVKSNFPHNKGRLRIPEEEQVRLGEIAKIDPGKSVPLTVSWREPRGPRAAARIDYGKGSLPVPKAPAG
jgi:hypothetical protein